MEFLNTLDRNKKAKPSAVGFSNNPGAVFDFQTIRASLGKQKSGPIVCWI